MCVRWEKPPGAYRFLQSYETQQQNVSHLATRTVLRGLINSFFYFLFHYFLIHFACRMQLINNQTERNFNHTGYIRLRISTLFILPRG